LVGSRSGKSQKLGKRHGSGVMHGRTHGHLHGLTTGLAAATEDHAQELIYFARDFLADRRRSFFSWAGRVFASVGRIWEI
jgi:hypothetical protein